MKRPKGIPTVLLLALFTVTLAACGGGSPDASTPRGAAPPPTSTPSSNATGRNSSTSPTSDASSASSSPVTNTGADSGTLKLTVLKYVLIPPDPGGITSSYLGIVRNDGSLPAMALQIHLLDDSGTDTGAVDTPLEVGDLPPGQSIGFRLAYTGKDPIQKPQFKIDGQPVDRSIADQEGNLTILNQQRGTSPDGFPTLEGDVRNEGATQIDSWTVNIIAYDASGNIVDVGRGSPAGDSQFPAHTTAKFRSILSDRGAKAVRYDLFATGQQG